MYPESEILTANTGFQRNYEETAYSKDYLNEYSLPVIMNDQDGNYWDIFGYAEYQFNLLVFNKLFLFKVFSCEKYG